MEYKQLFMALAIIVVGLIAFFGFSNDNEAIYGTSTTSSINATESRITSITGNLSRLSGQVGESGEPQEGASQGTGENNLVTRALGILGAIPSMVGLPLALLDDVGTIFPIDPRLITIAKYALIFAFFITLAYLFILGTTRLRT